MHSNNKPEITLQACFLFMYDISGGSDIVRTADLYSIVQVSATGQLYKQTVSRRTVLLKLVPEQFPGFRLRMNVWVCR